MKIVIRGGYKVPPKEIKVSDTIIAGYHKGTSSFGFVYVMEYESNTDNRWNTETPIKTK